MPKLTFKNTHTHYGLVAITLHWIIAFLIILLLIMGFYMTSLPDVGFNIYKIELIFAHKQIGMLVLVLATVRLIWRIINILPELAVNIPGWQQIVAYMVHIGLYMMMFGSPITGWLINSASGIPMTFFNLFPIPNIVPVNLYRMYKYISVHTFFAYILIILIGLHTFAALIHHFVDKDDTLRKMLP